MDIESNANLANTTSSAQGRVEEEKKIAINNNN